MIDINEYLDAFPGAKASKNINGTGFNEIILNITSNAWSKKAYVQGFDCETINFEKAINMFKQM